MKILLGIGIAVVAIVVAVVLVLGYLGFMPGVSNLFGSNKPKDLGVSFTANDLKTARAKTNTVITDLPSSATPEGSIKFGTPRQVDATFTQAECNALLNNHPWKYYPLKDCQLKINPDGTAEFTAVLLKDKLLSASQALGGSAENNKVLNDYLKSVPGDPAIDVVGKAGITNNHITGMTVTDFTVGKLSFTKQVQDNQGTLTTAAENLMGSIVGMNIQSLQIANGSITFKGTLPDVARSK